jgi:hypothetical protein
MLLNNFLSVILMKCYLFYNEKVVFRPHWSFVKSIPDGVHAALQMAPEIWMARVSGHARRVGIIEVTRYDSRMVHSKLLKIGNRNRTYEILHWIIVVTIYDSRMVHPK